MHRLNTWLPVVGMVIAGAAWAAGDGSISGPVAGYIADMPRGELRAILGVPGALSFSDPLPLPDGVTRVRLAPGQEYALVERAADSAAILLLKDGVAGGLTAIENGLPISDWVAFSPGASAALLYSGSSGRLQVITGLPGTPRVARDLDASALPEVPIMGSLSDDGTLVALASAGTLYRLSGEGPAQVLLATGAIRSIAVLRNGTDVAVADATSGALHIVRNAVSEPESRIVASGLNGLATIFPSSDDKSVYVARPGASMISSVDLASGEVRSLDVQAAPEGLLALRNRDTFLISAKPHQPGWIFYQDGAVGRAVFIPARQVIERNAPGKGGSQ